MTIFSAGGEVMHALVSDEEQFGAVVIGIDFTVVATLKLPPGSWVVFATVALGAASSVLGTASVLMRFQLDGNPYGTEVQSDFTVTDQFGGIVGGARVVPLTTGLVLDTDKTLQVACVATRGVRSCLSRRRLPPSRWNQ
jgi:hypothetical protein